VVAFGIFMYFLSFCVGGIVSATVLGGVLTLIGLMFVPNTVPGRSRFLWVCFGRPFLLIPWILLVFIAYSYANGIIFHRDNGMGINGHVPLPDGYILGYVNYDPGYILTPETTFGAFPHLGPGAISGVTEMQVAGPYVVGSRYLPSATDFDDWRSATGKYFLLDTRTRSVATFFTLDDLRSASASKGINLLLESPTDFYSRYRRTWFDSSLPIVSALSLVGLLASLWRRAKQIQHRTNGPQGLNPSDGEQSTAPTPTSVPGE
jgi:hypothetical protein